MDIDTALGWAIKLFASWALIAIPYTFAKGHAAQQRAPSTRVKVLLYAQHFAVACVLTGIVWLFYDLDGRIGEAFSDTRRSGFAFAAFVLTTISGIAGLNKGFKTESALSIYKAAALLRDHHRKKLEELVTLVTTALQHERDPNIRNHLDEALLEAHQALDADSRDQ